MTELPQWAVERAEKAITEAKEGMWVHDDEIEHGSAAVRIIARALAEAAPGWQPIETAPRDGTEFLGWNGRSIASCHWDSMDWADRSPRFLPLQNITHWMPLPAAPEVG